MSFALTNNNVVNTVTTFKGSYAGRLSVTKDIDTIKLYLIHLPLIVVCTIMKLKNIQKYMIMIK